MNEIQKAYWAGLIDGEGSIVISKTNGYHYIRLMIYQKNPEILYKVQKEFDCGSICNHKMKNVIIDGIEVRGERIMYSWHTTTNDAEKVIKSVLPYLRMKKNQAKLALEFQDYKRKTDIRGKRTSDGTYVKMNNEILEKREKFKQEISKLNKI